VTRLATAMGADQAWELAEAAARKAEVELRPLTTLEDADLILRVMVATWGEHQLVPREMIRALADSGNEPYGAFREGELVGYVLDWMGLDGDGSHLHSHMLAVAPGLRSRGVGYALKLAQRARALQAGYHVVRWTFDPLQARNAHFNIDKLGAVCDRFHRNFYGEMGDVLNRGDRSDRLVVRWDLERPPGPLPALRASSVTALRCAGPDDLPRPERAEAPFDQGGGVVAVAIPPDYPRIKELDPVLASTWRNVLGDVLEEWFGLGLVVAGFASDREAGGPRYLLSRPGARA
jgi:predicted GNAT superfamily acetyltransferase